MIAIDTNVLARYFVHDDASQTEQAIHFIDGQLSEEDPGFVAVVTIVELDWVCRSAYGFAAGDVKDLIRKLLEARQIIVEQAEIVEAALNLDGDDLADALIHAAGQFAGCAKTVTFDRKFARMAGVERLRA
jgi:predicted nucleic-acid-binding protein